MSIFSQAVEKLTQSEKVVNVIVGVDYTEDSLGTSSIESTIDSFNKIQQSIQSIEIDYSSIFQDTLDSLYAKWVNFVNDNKILLYPLEYLFESSQIESYKEGKHLTFRELEEYVCNNNNLKSIVEQFNNLKEEVISLTDFSKINPANILFNNYDYRIGKSKNNFLYTLKEAQYQKYKLFNEVYVDLVSDSELAEIKEKVSKFKYFGSFDKYNTLTVEQLKYADEVGLKFYNLLRRINHNVNTYKM